MKVYTYLRNPSLSVKTFFDQGIEGYSVLIRDGDTEIAIEMSKKMFVRLATALSREVRAEVLK